MGPNDAAMRQSPAQEGETIDADGGLVAPQPPLLDQPIVPRPGLIDFLDNRWRFAESSDTAARRAILLLAGALASSVLTLVLLVVLLVLLGLLASLLAGHFPRTVLALIPLLGAGSGVAITVYRQRR